MGHQFDQFNEFCKSEEEKTILEAYAEDCKKDRDIYRDAYDFINRLLDRAGLPLKIGTGKVYRVPVQTKKQ